MIDASETLRQLGGNKFIAMTGANSFVKGDNNIGFKVPRASNGIKYVRITLNSMDTYDVEFLNRGLNVVKRVDGVYDDQLQDVFTQETGLYTHL